MEEKALPKPQIDLPLPEKELPATTKNYNVLKSKIFIGFVLISTLIAFLIGGVMLGKNTDKENNPPATETSNPSPTKTSDNDMVVCTQDAKLCPDGTYVGRSGPKCEFKACPTQ